MRTILSLAFLLSFFSLSTKADLIDPLPPASSPFERRYQPILDFYTDSCYYTSAISLNGTINPGLPLSGPMSEPCRRSDRLENGNVYKDGRKTHCFRKATILDDDVENYTKAWYLGNNLIGWEHWPNSTVNLKMKVLDAFTGRLAPKLLDCNDVFTKDLKLAAGKAVDGFDPSYDEAPADLDDL
ncbi:Putative necrosis inducing protein [Septoria linicola]|uniref:Necrosis inducing protein n=1 Tax=Septoria linicola TaxID=215465 RepID=A0A9Q9B302_9PEZI|nr:putative necrosis inducing protein [Septoria linicola]USW56301.1 Putative necrosis inducing protein [Septoria linicola]